MLVDIDALSKTVPADEHHAKTTLRILRSQDIAEAQRKDKETQLIIKWIQNPMGNEPVPNAREYVVRDRLLFHPRADPRSSKMRYRYFIPKSLRDRAMEVGHTAGHLGYEGTISTLENFVYWPSFRKDSKDFISKCLVCREKALDHASFKLGDNPTPPHPWHTIGMDLLQLPLTKKDHKYLLVLVDLLTRYCVAYPLTDKSSNLIVSTLKKFVFNNPLLGPPATIVTDNGLEFCNQKLDRLIRRYGGRHNLTAPYNPKANGTTERMNRTSSVYYAVSWDQALNGTRWWQPSS